MTMLRHMLRAHQIQSLEAAALLYLSFDILRLGLFLLNSCFDSHSLLIFLLSLAPSNFLAILFAPEVHLAVVLLHCLVLVVFFALFLPLPCNGWGHTHVALLLMVLLFFADLEIMHLVAKSRYF